MAETKKEVSTASEKPKVVKVEPVKVDTSKKKFSTKATRGTLDKI
jgi:hypothetical protein